jgi:hypothetical protein
MHFQECCTRVKYFKKCLLSIFSKLSPYSYSCSKISAYTFLEIFNVPVSCYPFFLSSKPKKVSISFPIPFHLYSKFCIQILSEWHSESATTPSLPPDIQVSFSERPRPCGGIFSLFMRMYLTWAPSTWAPASAIPSPLYSAYIFSSKYCNKDHWLLLVSQKTDSSYSLVSLVYCSVYT